MKYSLSLALATTAWMASHALAQGAAPIPESPVPVPPVTGAAQVVDLSAAGLADARLKAGENEPVLSLESAVSQALQNNPTPKAARAALDAALARIGIARSAGGLPANLSGSATHQEGVGERGSSGSSSGFTSSTSSNSEQLGLNASLPVYNGGRVRNSRKAAEANARAQLATAQQTEQELAAQTILGYLGVLQNQELLAVEQGNLSVATERRRVSGVRFDAGAAAKLEVLRADSDLAAAQQRRIAAANSLAQSGAALNILLARVPETPIRLEPITSLQLPALARFPLAEQATAIAGGAAAPPSSELRADADTSLPSLAAAREEVNAADLNIAVQKSQSKPSLGLSLSALLRNPAQTIGRLVLNAGASLAQTVFDSGRISSQVREAQAQAQQVRFGLAGQQLQVANAIEGSLLTLDSARHRLASTDAGVVAAQEALRAAQLGYAAGAVTPLDVTDAQNALLTAQTDAVNARFDVASAQVQLAAATAITQSGSATGRSGLGSSAGTGQNSTISASGANGSSGINSGTSTTLGSSLFNTGSIGTGSPGTGGNTTINP